jgi:hypothetical protein
MWQIDNRTPFAVDFNWYRDRDGADTWLVAVKCTFLIRPNGETVLAPKQEPVLKAPVFRGEPAQSSLIYDCDLYLTKPATDIWVNGAAHAPGGKPVTQLEVTLKVAEVSKSLRIVGDRRWQKGATGLTASEPEPFTRMPIVYERSFGGIDPQSSDPNKPSFEARNPVGVGFAAAEGQPLPNIEEAGSLAGIRKRPAGFGPIAPHWQPRVQYGGTYDEAWQKDRCPLLPKDFDDRFFLSAPEDQRPKEPLKGGEPVELVNLTPGGLLKFRLPRVALGFETFFFTSQRVTHRGSLHTVILEPDVPRVMLVWHTHLQCHAQPLKLQKTIVSQKTVLNPPGT